MSIDRRHLGIVSGLLLAVAVLLAPGCSDESDSESTTNAGAPEAEKREYGFRPRVADRPTPSPGGTPVYGGPGKLTIEVLNGGVKHTGDVQLVVELKPDGTVGGTMRSKRLNLMTGRESGARRRIELFGTHADGKATIGTVDERGRWVAGWIQGTYNRIILKLKGSSSATELGLTVVETIEARLRPR